MRMRLFVVALFTVASAACSTASQEGTTAGQTGSTTAQDVPSNANSQVSGPQNSNATAAADANHPATGPLVRYLGRFDTANPNQVLFAWPASSILTRVNGTGLSVALSDPNVTKYQGITVNNWYDVFVDGVKTNTFQMVAGTTQYTAASGLVSGDHIIRISKRTEAQMGLAQFGGFTPLAGGTLLPAPQPNSKRLEFIGDSITAGYGADGNVATETGCGFTTATENADATYASMTADMLGAEFVALGYSGKGILQNDDCSGDPYYTLPILYPANIPIGDTGNTLDANFTDWVPQAVVINLGTNDYNEDNSCAVPTSANFTTAWVNFVKVVRGHYPSAAIFATVGPDLHGTNLTTVRANIASAVSTLKAAGDDNVFVLTLPENTGATGYGCAGHPNKASHAAMAAVVAPAIQKQLGW